MSECINCGEVFSSEELGCCNQDCYVCFDCVCPDCARCKIIHCECDSDAKCNSDSF